MKWILPLILFFAAGLANAAEKPKFTGEAIEPRPETVPLPSPTSDQIREIGNPPEAAQQDATPAVPQEAGNPSADARPLVRPVVYLYTSPGCAAGDQMRAAAKRGEFSAAGLNVQERDPPDWYTLCPTFHWTTPDGRSWKYPQDAASYRGVAGMLKAFDISTDGARLKIAASRGAAEMLAGSPMFEQVIKYLPDGTRITIELPRPMKVMLEDRTSLSYSKITGRLATTNGKARLTLDQPKPIVEAWKGVRWLNLGTTFGAQLDFFEFEDTTPPSVGVGTNRGLYRFVMEPQK